ncbi:DUF3649 domain-containing protein [Pseudomonas capsici]|uniref:DUF3649 domain-containing protein n=1 Tax=Pseudomonas capsici TaxID=2810614 RepID=A0ABT3BYU6_9PSED|nr:MULTISPECIES: DUF3649 domain-containing protein [Pseudomonas]MBN6715794.1 DUF3649 domain-containing protein [Pseudomonas capsici]MBN6720954.1 DUF3649 domain-containing protein [Pseudomonas capsici]MBN6725696.1 DUF3649 domain-containing protein [Pseudomonas capsici]MBX8610395.1 DUF3649 domain-containing protein [Pseudomonas cichorii]MBX8614598.1 DUF3649 domain-containing protein [Pseudomonas cichorii]
MHGSALNSPAVKKRPAKATGVSVSYRLAVTSRVLAAIFAGYLLASVTSICVAQWLPVPRAEAVITGMMLSFLVYLVAVLWCFACRTAMQAWVGVLLPSAILGAAYACGRWLS